MKFENTDVWGFEHAFRGLRNPMNSWERSDSYPAIDCGKCGIVECEGFCNPKEHNCSQFETYEIGKNDMNLAQKLIKGGSEHRKFLRQIFVSVDITAPLFWWKEFDTYKVGTTANSTSTMHKLAQTPITMDCFETDDMERDLVWSCPNNFPWSITSTVQTFINALEDLRKKYVETKDKKYWKELIRWLPESWLQTRTVTMNYENLRNMYFQRKGHKLTEWSESFIKWIESLPYAKELIMYTGEDKQ